MIVNDPVVSALDKEIAGLEAQLADAAAGSFAPERVIVDDGDPDGDAKIAAVQARYPNKIVVVYRVIDSPLRFAARPEVMAGAGR